MRRPLSSYNRLFYVVIVWLRQLARRMRWVLGRQNFATKKQAQPLAYRVYKHQSVLVRKLGDVDLQLQYNKVTNVRLATARLSGLVIHPGETFSFCYLVGKPTRRKGYLEGMLLSNGEAISGIGGGICQVANLIHWLCLHSPLTVTERHHHSFDPFPDSGRVVPFGCGASFFTTMGITSSAMTHLTPFNCFFGWTKSICMEICGWSNPCPTVTTYRKRTTLL